MIAIDSNILVYAHRSALPEHKVPSEWPRPFAGEGRRIYDLPIALIARDSGATEFWTHDAAFSPVRGLVSVIRCSALSAE